MKKIVFLSLLSFFSVCLYAQGELFIRDSDIIKQVVEKAAKSRAKGDQVVQDRFVGIISDAFKDYWEEPQSRSGIHADSLNNLKEGINVLEYQLRALNDTIKELNSILKNNKKNEALIRQIDEYALHVKKVITETDSIDRLISETKASLLAIKPQVEMLEKAGEIMEGKKAEFEQIAQDIKEIEKDCYNASLLDMGFYKMAQSSLKLFQEKRRAMKSINPKQENETVQKVETINRYMAIMKVLQDGIAQMGFRYNQQRNMEIVDSINYRKSNIKKLSKEQEEECREIIYALQGQESAYSFFLSFLDKTAFDIYAIGDETNRAQFSNFIKEELDKQSSPLRFSKYYTTFQSVLNQIKRDMSPNSSSLPISKVNSEEKLKKYTDSQKNKL